ncbi:acyl-[acyl-carrier-protein]-phospholipid O-acyltransferase / long-chain-fatty-acid--[acyl-carrier-protein] ligase [Burkholderiales bacterium]|nr:acyl-[acyl-carrier-protein]-phospholipid O-acyltransferase / long-chain-fatty-acid--[acyl-carrier-protein] ligase [Burkholderiales bacterium]
MSEHVNPGPAGHEPSQFDLMRERRFAPFFWTQFLGAANDNVYKNALVIFVAFQAASMTSADPDTLVNLAGAVFIAPFMLLSATGGQLADKFEKSRVIRALKVSEIAIMAMGLAGFLMRDVAVLFAALALMGVQSTLFGPVKYAILPQHLKPEELVGGNGLVEMGTFVAILLGTIAGGLIVGAGPDGPLWAGSLAIAIAVAGWLVSRDIPVTPAVDPGLVFNWNPFTETWCNLVLSSGNRVVWLSMIGISWFWFYGALFLAQFAGFSRDHLGGNETVVTALLAVFSVGIGAGSLLCERLSRRRVELGLVPFGSIGLTLFAVDLWLASRGLSAPSVAGLEAFVAKPAHWRVAFDLVMIGVFGGFYIVPLYALIQERSAPSHRSRIIAANNILNAVFMVAAALIAILLLEAGLTVPDLFLVTGLMNAAVALFIYRLVPEFLMRFLAWILINAVYRVRAEGLGHIPDDGPCVVACNHVSYVDAVAIAACVRRPVRFVMDHRIFAIPLLSFIFRTMGAIPIASAREDPALKERAFAEAAAVLARGEVLGIFPEGRLTPDGELGIFRPGLSDILERTPAPVVPMALKGLWGSFFSRAANGRVMRRFRGVFSRIGLAAGAPIAPRAATPERLRAEIAALRGNER